MLCGVFCNKRHMFDFINKATQETSSYNGGQSTSKVQKVHHAKYGSNQRSRDQARRTWQQKGANYDMGGEEGWARVKVEPQILDIIIEMASTSMGLASGIHCGRSTTILNKQSEGRLGKRCSIVNLLWVVHKNQLSTTKADQKPWINCPEYLARRTNKSMKLFGFQLAVNHDRTKIQTNLAKTHQKIMCSVFSFSPQREKVASAFSWCFMIWSLAGRCNLIVCQRKILILRGIGAHQTPVKRLKLCLRKLK